MWTLSGFADEISPDVETQCVVASGLGLRFVELRSAWGTNVLDLDDDPRERVAGLLRRHDAGSVPGRTKNENTRTYGASSCCATPAACRIRSRWGSKSSSTKI